MSESETIELKGKPFAFGKGRLGKHRRFDGTIFNFGPKDDIAEIIEIRAGTGSLRSNLLYKGVDYTHNKSSITLNNDYTYIRVVFIRNVSEDEFQKATEDAPFLRDIRANLLANVGGAEKATAENEKAKFKISNTAIVNDPGKVVSGFMCLIGGAKPTANFVDRPRVTKLLESAGDGSANKQSTNTTVLGNLLKSSSMKDTNLNKAVFVNGTRNEIQNTYKKHMPGINKNNLKEQMKLFIPSGLSDKILKTAEEASDDKEAGTDPIKNIVTKQKEVIKARAQLSNNAGAGLGLKDILGNVLDMLPAGARSNVNVQPNLLAAAKGLTPPGIPGDINLPISNISPGLKLSAEEIANPAVIKELMPGADLVTGKVDYNTNMSKAIGKGKLTPSMQPAVGKDEVSSAVAESNWKGYLTNSVDYNFETLGSLDKLCNYLDGHPRVTGKGINAFTFAIVDWTTDDLVDFDTPGLHEEMKKIDLDDEISTLTSSGANPTEASTKARKELEGSNSRLYGLQAHFVIERDGTCKKGRPLGETLDPIFDNYADKGIYILIIAGKTNPPTTQQAATLDTVCAGILAYMYQIQLIGVYEIDSDYIAPGLDIEAIRKKYGKVLTIDPADSRSAEISRAQQALIKPPEVAKPTTTKLKTEESFSPTKITKDYENIDPATGNKKVVTLEEAQAEMKTALTEIQQNKGDIKAQMETNITKARGEASKILGDKNAKALLGATDGLSAGFDENIKKLNFDNLSQLTDKFNFIK
ncbi:MAG: hypothetical protein CMD72_04705 [Gammaproteobacteria bacterium]|nr:hypothetical protein [Gammaproteobacteria bacterium]